MDKVHKIIYTIDLVLVLSGIAGVIFFVGYTTPLIISPIDDLKTSDTSILFSFENADVILIDDNIDFTSPQEIFAKDNLVINLKPGVYYWKVKGVLESEIRKLTIETEVDLKLKKKDNEGRYEIVNSGNVRLNVEVYENEKFTGNVILGVDESEEVSGTKYIGRQDE